MPHRRRLYLLRVADSTRLISQFICKICVVQFKMASLGNLAMVTGAGSGIGRATCRILASQGATVIAADRNLPAAEESLHLTKRDGWALEIDVSKVQSVTNAVNDVIKKYKRPPTIIVNSAGIIRDQYLLKMSEPEFDIVLDTNLKGTFLVMQYFARAMVDYRVQGSIINISSHQDNIGQSNYAASKAGVEALTRVGAKEFGKFNIRVNAIIPGFIDTELIAGVPAQAKQRFLGNCALGRFGTVDEVAQVIAFLASDKSGYINGALLEVNGG